MHVSILPQPVLRYMLEHPKPFSEILTLGINRLFRGGMFVPRRPIRMALQMPSMFQQVRSRKSGGRLA